MSGRVHVDATGQFGILLTILRPAQSRAMDHGVRVDSLPDLLDSGVIREVEIGASEPMNLPTWRPSNSRLHHIVPDQSRRSRQDDTQHHGASMAKQPLQREDIKRTVRVS